MIQINLIPDVKKEYLRAQRTRNLAVSISILVGIAAAGLVVILGIILGGQYVVSDFMKGRIDDEYQKLASVEDLPELLTIQHQLEVLPDQHLNSMRTSRLFNVLSAINPEAPNNVTFSTVELDPESTLVTLEGNADGGYPAVEALKKTIERTTFEYRENGSDEVQTVPMASNVGIESTSFGEDNSGSRVLRFTMSFKYADKLFSNQAKGVPGAQGAPVTSPVRRIDVTDSQVRVPDSLFQSSAESEEEQ